MRPGRAVTRPVTPDPVFGSFGAAVYNYSVQFGRSSSYLAFSM